MDCNTDMLQEYLDHELSEQKCVDVQQHLASCRACRRCLSEMRLLWADLGHYEEVETPSSLPLLRQQAIFLALKPTAEQSEQPGQSEQASLAWPAGQPEQTVRRATGYQPESSNEWNFWASQRMAWQPLAYAVEMIPGMDRLEGSAQSLASALPKTALKTAGFLVRSYAKNRGNRVSRGRW